MQRYSLMYCAVNLMIGMIGAGCACEPRGVSQDTATIRVSMLSGFEDSSSRLYVSKGRLYTLMSYLGYDAGKYSRGCDHTSDGTSLRLWNYDRTSAVVITKGQQAHLPEHF